MSATTDAETEAFLDAIARAQMTERERLKADGWRIVKLKAFDEVMYEHYILPWYVAEEL